MTSPSTLAIGENTHRFVIHGRSKERSDAAQTRGSMPRLQRVATVQNSAPLCSRIKVTEWTLGSSRRRFAAAPPWMTKIGASANPSAVPPAPRWSP
ncbi:hypothetical protein FJ425_14585 [Mesorhizobium sp. B2-7-2]|nr:hypothetical protein FJ425_14585 [Mesorhizobium sp. B2-7-2]